MFGYGWLCVGYGCLERPSTALPCGFDTGLVAFQTSCHLFWQFGHGLKDARPVSRVLTVTGDAEKAGQREQSRGPY